MWRSEYYVGEQSKLERLSMRDVTRQWHCLIMLRACSTTLTPSPSPARGRGGLFFAISSSLTRQNTHTNAQQKTRTS